MAADPEGGHDAASPVQIPAQGWWQVTRRVWRETVSDQVSMAAASCAFYAMLALFPAITVLISLYGLLFDPSAIERQLAAIRDVLPAMAFDLVAQRLHDLVSRPASSLSWGLVIGTVVALWSASAGIKSLMTALNIAYEEREKRGLIRFNLTALLFTLCALFGVALSLTLIVGLPTVLRLDLLGPWGAMAARLVTYALLLACVVRGAGAPLSLRAVAGERALALGDAGVAPGGGGLAGRPRSCSRSTSAISRPTTPPTAPWVRSRSC